MIRASSVQNTPWVAPQQTKRIVPPWIRRNCTGVTLRTSIRPDLPRNPGFCTRAFHMLALLLFLVTPLGAQQIYDLLLKNGHVIDPKNERNGRYDIAIVGNKIVRMEKTCRRQTPSSSWM